MNPIVKPVPSAELTKKYFEFIFSINDPELRMLVDLKMPTAMKNLIDLELMSQDWITKFTEQTLSNPEFVRAHVPAEG
jgi:hypothetical protein